MKKLLFILYFSISGCAVHHQSLGPSIQAPELTENAFIAADGRNHALEVWAPEGDPWAVLVAVHGFNDYRMAFDLPGKYFAEHGILVLAYDQRGFGEDAEAGYWAEKEALRSDLLAVLALAREKYPGRPLIVLGESMGAAVALYALEGKQEAADGLILVAPAVWSWRPVNILYQPALWLTAHIMPGKKFRGRMLNLEPSDNEEVLIALSRDPNVIKATRIDAILGLSRIMRQGMKSAADIRIPTYLLYGGKDDLVPRKMFGKLWNRLPPGQRTGLDDPHGYHLLLRDCRAGEVWKYILEYIANGSGKEVVPKPVENLCQSPSSSE